MVKSGKSMSIAVSMRISVELRAAMARERILKQGRPGRPEKKQVQPGCERLHNVCRKHPQPQRSPEMGTLATHSERTFDSLPLVHIGQFVKTWYKWYNHVCPKTSKDIFPANTLLNSGCQGAMQTWSYAFQGFLGSRFDL